MPLREGLGLLGRPLCCFWGRGGFQVFSSAAFFGVGTKFYCLLCHDVAAFKLEALQGVLVMISL